MKDATKSKWSNSPFWSSVTGGTVGGLGGAIFGGITGVVTGAVGAVGGYFVGKAGKTVANAQIDGHKE